MAIKKLIEVALPLDAINSESAYEKLPGIGAHPRGLHQWWARRPFVTARAVIWASLVDDPSSHPDLFPTEEAQNKERERLFGILSQLVLWKNSDNENILKEAHKEILKATNFNLPVFLDPFAGGGAIPFEAQRLGLKSCAHDLNPIAVMINKSMIEITPRFTGFRPVNSESNLFLKHDNIWPNLSGFIDDVRFYGRRVHEEVVKKVGHLYPLVDVPNTDQTAEVVAWIWARTAKCPNPTCGCKMPLVGTYVLAKKKGRCAWIEPKKVGNGVRFEVHNGTTLPRVIEPKKGRGAAFICPLCGETTLDSYIKSEGAAGRIGTQLMAIVADGANGRLYLSPNEKHIITAKVNIPEDYPDGAIPTNPRWFSPPAFGMVNYADLFTNRQLTVISTLADAVIEMRKKIEKDAVSAGMENDHIPLSEGGHGARAYSEALSVFLAFAVDRIIAFSVSVSRWSNTNEKVMNCYARQAMPMVWDFPEANVLGNCVGGFIPAVDYIADCIEKLVKKPAFEGIAITHNAQEDCGMRNLMISTDPPYYDNVGYADLSDFYYIWMRKMLKDVYPNIFKTVLVPKADELIATPYRFNGNAKMAKEFFENGMYKTFCQLYSYATNDIPVTVYYAFKQTDSTNEKDVTASTGWETMLFAIIQAGFAITGTWPMRTEQATRALGNGTNALASSIVLVCRKRSHDAPICTRRNFINELKQELRPALKKLQSSNIAPVDLAQSAIGPGMAVYSKYTQVLEADGTPMSVRSALQVINQELDLFFNEQDSELDSESRFCIDLYSQYAFNELSYGEALTLATAKNTSVEMMASHGTVYARNGKVHLIERAEIPDRIDEHGNNIWLLCQQLTYKMETEGIEGCANAVAPMVGSNAERAKDLAYRLYTIAERKHWAQEAYAYNALVVSWPEIQARAGELKAVRPEQLTLID